MVKRRNWFWGIILLLAATSIVANQLGWLEEFNFNFRTFVAAAFAVCALAHCFTHKTITPLPYAVAFTYIVLRNQDIVPYVSTWALLIAAVLASIGLGYLFPKRKYFSFINIGGTSHYHWGNEKKHNKSKKIHTTSAETGDLDNNPSVSVSFGGTSRYLRADCLETVTLSCNFGGMDIYLDQAQLSENGATVHIDCKFGGIDLYVPRHWRINEEISCTFGGADVNGRAETLTEDSPQLTITGNVMFGGVDINYI